MFPAAERTEPRTPGAFYRLLPASFVQDMLCDFELKAASLCALVSLLPSVRLRMELGLLPPVQYLSHLLLWEVVCFPYQPLPDPCVLDVSLHPSMTFLSIGKFFLGTNLLLTIILQW